MLTRLAPSPTGALHLGNARTFIVNWLLARQHGWRIALRIEDIDGPRIKPGTDRLAIDDLRWLGIDWDEGPVYQSARLPLYDAAIERLIANGAAYPCVCSRKEIEQAASAPHAEDGAAVYPGTCRGRFKSIADATAVSGRPPAIRFAVPAGEIVTFVDEFSGLRSYDVAAELGDFVIAKGDEPRLNPSTQRENAARVEPLQASPARTPSYQLAVVVDDAVMGVTHIVRGDDLIDSTPRQILLYRALDLEPRIPRHYHLPLVIGEDGRRLAKRHGDTRLATYRGAGVTAARMRAWLARSIGVECGNEVSIDELRSRFELSRLPRGSVTFMQDDDAWLRD